MSAEVEQIKTSYELLGMTVQEIATDRELDELAVKAALMSASAKYRAACRAEGENLPVDKEALNFTDEQLERVNEKIFSIAVGSENESVALRACMYIRDDKRGRLDAVKALTSNTINVLNFNEALKRADSAVAKALGKVIEA